MQVYGFPYNVVFGLVSVPAYNPKNDLAYNDYVPFNSSANSTIALTAIYPGFNGGAALACDGEKNSSYVTVSGFPDWLSLANNKVDLRTAYLNCVGGQLQPRFNFTSDCDRPHDKSEISGAPTCFSVEALYYAQSAYFATVVLVQWSNIFACKSRKVFLILFRLLSFIQLLTQLCSMVSFAKPVYSSYYFIAQE